MTTTAPAPPAAIDASGIEVTYPARRRQPARTAVQAVTLVVAPGQFVALLGPNGCGKSSFMRAVAGTLPLAAGRVSILGEDDRREQRRHLAMIFQTPGLDPFMTVDENLHDHAALFGLSRSEAQVRIDAEVERAGLAGRRRDRAGTLSGGLQRRVDLCRALLPDPSVLLLDEPTVGLDPSARAGFIARLDEQRRTSGTAILMSTHLLDEADAADRVVFMHEGRIIADDEPGALRRSFGDMFMTVPGPQPPPISTVAWRAAPGRWIGALSADPVQRRATVAALAESQRAFSIGPPTLTDIFELQTGTRFLEDDA